MKRLATVMTVTAFAALGATQGVAHASSKPYPTRYQCRPETFSAPAFDVTVSRTPSAMCQFADEQASGFMTYSYRHVIRDGEVLSFGDCNLFRITYSSLDPKNQDPVLIVTATGVNPRRCGAPFDFQFRTTQ